MKILEYAYFTADNLLIYDDHFDSKKSYIQKPIHPKRFFKNKSAMDGNRQSCIYCQQQMKKVFWEHADLTDGCEGYESNMVFECSKCGWWKCEYFKEDEGYLWRWCYQNHKIANAIVRQFDVSSNELPLDSLQREALKSEKVLYNISPRKMEELVKYCFESYYCCEVHHCGKSHDGGVDLLVVTSDDPILVQVKRRESPAKGESVSAVRDFLGAMFLRQSKSGVFVTTAAKFSREAQKVKETLLASQLVNYFDLIDIHSFISMLGVSAKNSNNPPWIKAVGNFECMDTPNHKDDYGISRDDYSVRNDYVEERRALGLRTRGKGQCNEP